MRLLHRWRRELSFAVDAEPDLEDREAHGAIVPWEEARASLWSETHRQAVAVLEDAQARVGAAAKLEARGGEGTIAFFLVPARAEAATIGFSAFPSDREVMFVYVSGADITWETDDTPPQETAALFREHVDAALEGRFLLRRCRAGDRWRHGFDLLEKQGARTTVRHSYRYVADLWWTGQRVLTRFAPY